MFRIPIRLDGQTRADADSPRGLDGGEAGGIERGGLLEELEAGGSFAQLIRKHSRGDPDAWKVRRDAQRIAVQFESFRQSAGAMQTLGLLAYLLQPQHASGSGSDELVEIRTGCGMRGVRGKR